MPLELRPDPLAVINHTPLHKWEWVPSQPNFFQPNFHHQSSQPLSVSHNHHNFPSSYVPISSSQHSYFDLDDKSKTELKTTLCCAGTSTFCLIQGMALLGSMQRTNYVVNAIFGSLLILTSYSCFGLLLKICFSPNEPSPLDCVKNCCVTNVACTTLGLLTAALGFFTLSSINPMDINAEPNNGAYAVIGPLLIAASLVCCFRNIIFGCDSKNTSERTPLRSAEQRV